jgi:hypothetical protein
VAFWPSPHLNLDPTDFQELLEQHYADLAGKGFFKGLIEYSEYSQSLSDPRERSREYSLPSLLNVL